MRLRRACGAVLLAALGACAHAERHPPAIPTVPLTFEANLTAATECEYLGQVVGANAAFDAERREANLIIEFVIMTSTSSYNGVTVEGADIKGTAVKCPPETVQRLLAAARRPSS